MIPALLQNMPRWVGWEYGPHRKNGKRSKIPIDPHTGRKASVSDPATWGTYDEARTAVVEFDLDGIGFVFVAGDGLVGVDLDGCVVDGVLSAEAAAVVASLNSYTEISPSGSGVKIWVKASKSPTFTGCSVKNVAGCKQIEIYDDRRFFAATGKHWQGTPGTIEPRQEAIDALCARLQPQGDGVQNMHSVPPQQQGQFQGILEICRRYIVRRPDAVSGRGGHSETFGAACVCFRFGLDQDQARIVMRWYNVHKCHPMWTDAEIEHKLIDARKRVEADGETGRLASESHSKKPWHNDLPKWIRELDRPRLRPYQRAVLQAIADRCDRKPIDADGSLGGAFIGYDDIARKTGMCRRSVANNLSRLKSMGLLVLTERGGIDKITGAVTANTYLIPGAENLGGDGVQEMHPK